MLRPARLASLFLAAIAASSAAPKPAMRHFMGLNGHTVRFKPELYAPVASHVRDYHPVSWDLGDDTSKLPPFPLAKNKVNWQRVYGSWKDAGWTTSACLMLSRLDAPAWKDLETDSRSYAAAFARRFGPSSPTPLVHYVEIGNEPGSWSDKDYSRIFRSMASAIRETDPAVKIATCNVNAGKSGKYHKSVDCVASMPDLVDVLTIHSYPQLEGWPTWKRSFPEDPQLEKFLPDIAALCSWRDKHMPGKPVWITEFGYDSTTKPNDKSGSFARWQGVTDKQQAQWLVRSFLLFSSLPVDRAFLYFFDDSDKPSVHASSGLTRNFKPKPAFHAVAHLYDTLGDYRFERVVKTDSPQLHAHDYRHTRNPKRRIRVCWTATGNDTPLTTEFTGTPGKLVSSSRMPLDEHPVPGGATQPAPGTIRFTATGSPLYLMLEAD